jgi:hypothetical protein
MDRLHVQPHPLHRTTRLGRIQCGNSKTTAIQRSYDFHPKTALLWTGMAGFTVAFWACLGMFAFG